MLPDAHWYNLLLDRELLRLMRDPGLFRREIEALPSGSWVVVDEVQKLPALLNDVHDALASYPKRWRFALTGSSARRLRRGDANLLGRPCHQPADVSSDRRGAAVQTRSR